MNTFFQSPSDQPTTSIGIASVTLFSGAENFTYSKTVYTFPLDNTVFTFGALNIGVGIVLPTTGQIWPLGVI